MHGYGGADSGSGKGSCPLCIPGVLCVSIRLDNLGDKVQLTPIASCWIELSLRTR